MSSDGDNGEDEVLFTCELCGGTFKPEPDSMIEWNVASELVPEGEADTGWNREELEGMNEWDLKAIGLSPEQRDELLAGKTIRFGGCICIPCQNKLLEEQPPEQ